MCTVVIDVPETAGEPVRLLAVRDEERDRPWRGLGPWWPERGGILGVRDDRAGGAWLAVDPVAGRLAVLLNRQDLSTRSDDEVVSRGAIPLDAVGDGIPDRPVTRGFNLVEVDADGAHLVEWDGLVAQRSRIAPGTHMIAHHEVDDPVTPRIGRWLEDFRRAGTGAGEDWWMPWLDVVARATGDPSASVLRRDAHDGHVLESLLVCVASIGAEGVDVRQATPAEPGRWDDGLIEGLRRRVGDPDVAG
ncbi:NRDE family protein [Microbacterium sp. lyk4-40-TSB-66]|uniref:NRDE family protein n=1 Tax=Microbacterium sp. lyk4-40-TSB-66 TaxID=3040294 RepID=UPI00254ED4C4|nr:NRDE family protein [Microbacterium sp. lyk4-40-TSB-66]